MSGAALLLGAAGLFAGFASTSSASTPACAAAWSASAVYTGGQTASYDNVNYTANWWTQGNNPSTNSGAAGSGEPWTSTGTCGSGSQPAPPPPPAPSPSPSPSPEPTTGGVTFAPYVDMSLSVDENILAMQQQANVKAVTLAFLVGNGCSVEWGGYTTPLPSDNLWDGTSIQSIVQSLQNSGVKVILSFGGANGPEPAYSCTNVTQLQALYQSVINRYKVTTLDFDIEGSALTDTTGSIARRDQALKALKAANPSLVISYTLPVLPTGLDANGLTVIKAAKADGVALNVVNIMAMDYGTGVDNSGQMGTDALDAAAATHTQVQNAGFTSTTIGITPMIGVNDVRGETFQLTDAQKVYSFATSNSYVTRLGMWSLARDNGSCSGAATASATCSGLTQAEYAFSAIFDGEN